MRHCGAAAIKWQKADKVRRMHSVSLGSVPAARLPKEKSHFLTRCETSCTLSCRYRYGSGKSCSQLTVEELSSFVRQLYNLPCSLPQAPMLKVGSWCILGFHLICMFFSFWPKSSTLCNYVNHTCEIGSDHCVLPFVILRKNSASSALNTAE